MAFERTEGSRPARPMRRGRKKVCSFCVDRIDTINFKPRADNTGKPKSRSSGSFNETGGDHCRLGDERNAARTRGSRPKTGVDALYWRHCADGIGA